MGTFHWEGQVGAGGLRTFICISKYKMNKSLLHSCVLSHGLFFGEGGVGYSDPANSSDEMLVKFTCEQLGGRALKTIKALQMLASCLKQLGSLLATWPLCWPPKHPDVTSFSPFQYLVSLIQDNLGWMWVFYFFILMVSLCFLYF